MTDDANTVDLATELTVAWLSNPNTRVSADDVPGFLASMHRTLNGLSSSTASVDQSVAPEHTPAVTARKSLASRDHILSMIDGKPYKSLKRHIGKHGLSPAQYRERYGLKADYPMVAPAYSEARRETAHRLGLGRKPGQKSAPKITEKPVRGRKSAATAKAAAQAHLGTDQGNDQ